MSIYGNILSVMASLQDEPQGVDYVVQYSTVSALMIITFSRLAINRMVVNPACSQLNREKGCFPLSQFAPPENLASRDLFGRRVPRQPVIPILRPN